MVMLVVGALGSCLQKAQGRWSGETEARREACLSTIDAKHDAWRRQIDSRDMNSQLWARYWAFVRTKAERKERCRNL